LKSWSIWLNGSSLRARIGTLGVDMKRVPARALGAARAAGAGAVGGLVVCALLGAALNVYRTAYAVQSTVREWDGFQNGARLANGEPVHEVRSYASIVWAVPDWRPLRLRLWLSAPRAAAGQATRVLLEADHTPLGTATVTSAWAAYEFVIRTPASPLRKLTVQMNADVAGPNGPALDVGDVSLTPVVTAFGLARHGGMGALIGALAYLLFVPRRWRKGEKAQEPAQDPAQERAQARGGDAAEAPGRVATAIVAAALLAYFGAWALVKPPFLAADEPQHLMRAAAILKTPWLAPLGTFPHDARFLNPLALWHPPQLWKIIFPRARPETMTREDVAALKRAAWRPASELEHQEPYRIALASYPTLYYWVVFAGGQLTTTVAGLTPYQSVYAYRAASLLAATVLWVIVYRLLRELFGRARIAATVLAFLVLNPMVGYLTSSVSADAFAIPLGTLAVLACWRTLSTGTHAWSATMWLLLGAFAKPSGLQIMAAVAAVTVLLAAVREASWPHVRLTLVAIGRAAIPAWLLFYAWSPTIFVGAPVTVDLPTYVLRFVQRFPEFWVYFWGLLGWMDYKLPDIWYEALAVIVALNAICLWWKPGPGPFRGFSAFTLLVFAAFAASTAAGEFIYLKDIGYVVQGRYFLPAIAGLAPLVLHRVRTARVALLATIVLMNVLLMHATVVRCYGGDYGTLWFSMPFVSGR